MDIVRECIDTSTTKMAAGKEEMIKRAIDGVVPGWEMAAILPRLTREVHIPSRVETILLDGKPIIEFYPLEISEPRWTGDGWVQEVSQNYRVF